MSSHEAMNSAPGTVRLPAIDRLSATPHKVVVLARDAGLIHDLERYAGLSSTQWLPCSSQEEMVHLLQSAQPVSLVILDDEAVPALPIIQSFPLPPPGGGAPPLVLALIAMDDLAKFRGQTHVLEYVDYLLKPLHPPVVRQRLRSYLSLSSYTNELAVMTDQHRLTVDVMGRMIENRRSSELERDKFRRVLDAVRDPILMFDARSLLCVYANCGATLEFGYSHDEWMNIRVVDLQDKLDEAALWAEIKPLATGESSSRTVETEFLRKDGGRFPVRLFIQYYSDPGKDNIFVCFVSNIAEYVAQTAALEHLSLHDSLTGLPNRALFLDRLTQAVASARRVGQSFGVFMMDLDRFKEVNDTLGHHVGDLLLQKVSAVLSSVLRESDTVARLGGDEFALLLSNIGDLSVLVQIAEKTSAAVRGPFVVEDHLLDVGSSIGIVRYPDNGEDGLTLMRRADVAMYEAKRRRVDHMVYEAGQDKDNLLLLTLESEFRNAIQNDQLELYYQPKIELTTRKLVGMEALVRWNHPQKGLVPPDAFIAMAERSGLIVPLTTWVIEDAMRQCAQWDAQGHQVKVAVNLSVRNLMDTQLPKLIETNLRRWGLQPWQIIFELTESDIMEDSQRVLQVMAEINALGIKFAVDDFGTGYSSLSYLKKLPVSEIKIDKSFISNMTSDGDDMVIAHSIIHMAHHLGLRVVAEGVESREIWELLKVLQCDVAQGYYFSRPMPVGEIDPWVKRGVFEPLPDQPGLALNAAAC